MTRCLSESSWRSDEQAARAARGTPATPGAAAPLLELALVAERRAVVERPRKIAAEQMHRARSIDDDVVVPEDRVQKVENLLIFRMKPLGTDVEPIIAVLVRAGEPTGVIVALDDDGTAPLAQDRAGKAQAGHTGANN